MAPTKEADECVRCKELLKPETTVWGEMCTCWKPFGKCGDTKPEHSQGWFPFGTICAKRIGFTITKELNDSGNNDLIGVWKKPETISKLPKEGCKQRKTTEEYIKILDNIYKAFLLIDMRRGIPVKHEDELKVMKKRLKAIIEDTKEMWSAD